ncbi:hypothetical protein AAFF_G00104730 [Aldrovandia affinis]|uniref:Uncharacterized protein n=1 Tax=Aldrovandia affinis TaxID=143900 RepID=A0AAD7T1Y8_9TELE|nr:hypothetical protein AAFF_G00104730 [Aldrovandia affinis]
MNEDNLMCEREKMDRQRRGILIKRAYHHRRLCLVLPVEHFDAGNAGSRAFRLNGYLRFRQATEMARHTVRAVNDFAARSSS